MAPLPPICLTTNYLQISLNALLPQVLNPKTQIFYCEHFFFFRCLSFCIAVRWKTGTDKKKKNETDEKRRMKTITKKWYCCTYMYMSHQRVKILRAINDLLGIIRMGHMWLKFNRQSSMMRNKTKQTEKNRFSCETVSEWKSVENIFFAFSRKDTSFYFFFFSYYKLLAIFLSSFFFSIGVGLSMFLIPSANQIPAY